MLGEDEDVEVGPNQPWRQIAPPYSDEQVEFITRHETLESWATFPLPQRVKILRRLYPQQKHTVYRLRQLYRTKKIRMRPIGIKCTLSDSQE